VVAFYDIDTPVTLARLAAGDHMYISPELIPGYDLYLSFTGGPTLDVLEQEYGSPAARPLYCSADTRSYRPQAVEPRWDLSYLGTYSADRQPTLERLLTETARQAPELRFAVGGPGYPEGVDWPANVERIEHVPPSDHPGFYAGSRFTLNVTRADMIKAGHSPSVRLFEAAACATPVISDRWAGLSELFEPGREIVLADTAAEVLQVLRETEEDGRRAMGSAARLRVLGQHTAVHRALELERHLIEAARGRASVGQADAAASTAVHAFSG
jgi:spore maturation protein CgeB